VTRVGDALSIEVPTFDDAGVTYDHMMVATSTHLWTATIADTAFDFAFIAGPSGTLYMRNRNGVLIRR